MSSGVDQLLSSGLTLGTPIVYASVGGLFSYNARIFNIGLEGYMLVGAYFSVIATRDWGSPWLGVLAGLVAGAVLATVMGFAVLSWGADEVIVGIALNLFALGLTSYLLTSGSNTGSGFIELKSGLPAIHASWLAHTPILKGLFIGHDPVVVASWVVALIAGVVIYRTRFGLRIRASGESELAARAVGVDVWRTKMWTFVLSGALCGIGGAELALGSVHLFSQDMTAGSGIIAFAAVVFGAGRPGVVVIGALLFGFAEAESGILQAGSGVAPQFVLMVPYVAAIVALGVLGTRRRQKWSTA